MFFCITYMYQVNHDFNSTCSCLAICTILLFVPYIHVCLQKKIGDYDHFPFIVYIYCYVIVGHAKHSNGLQQSMHAHWPIF